MLFPKFELVERGQLPDPAIPRTFVEAFEITLKAKALFAAN
jgi:hypothetical protein